MRTCVLRALVVIAVLDLLSCSENDSGSTFPPGTTSPSGEPGHFEIEGGAPSSSTSSPDGGEPVRCNFIEQTAPVPTRDQVGSLPAPQGGTIVTGKYHLLAEHSLDGDFDELRRVVWQIKGSLIEGLGTREPPSATSKGEIYNRTWSTSGTQLTSTTTCPTSSAETKTFGYTATSSSLTIVYARGYAEFQRVGP